MRFGDRIKETTTETGTGDITLAGPATGFIGFYELFTDGDVVPYCIVDGENIEIGEGTLVGASVLERTTLIAVISAGAAVVPPTHINLSGDPADVFCSPPASFVQQLVSRGVSIALASGSFIS